MRVGRGRRGQIELLHDHTEGEEVFGARLTHEEVVKSGEEADEASDDVFGALEYIRTYVELPVG